jgi:hypothetical protein
MSRPRRSCWGRRGTCADTRRLGPDDEDTAVAAEQLRTVVEHLIAAGHWKNGDPKIWIVGDSGYDGPRLAFLLADLPVALLVPVRSDRVMHFPAPLCAPGIVGDGSVSAGEFAFNNPQTWREPDHIPRPVDTALPWSVLSTGCTHG